jgi:hypothetical protein
MLNPTPSLTSPMLLLPTFSVSTNILPLPSERLKHPWRQLILDQSRKNHHILRLLQQLIGKDPTHLILIHPLKKALTVPGAAHDTPEEHVANVAGDLLGVRVEAVGCGADVADIALCG